MIVNLYFMLAIPNAFVMLCCDFRRDYLRKYTVAILNLHQHLQKETGRKNDVVAPMRFILLISSMGNTNLPHGSHRQSVRQSSDQTNIRNAKFFHKLKTKNMIGNI